MNYSIDFKDSFKTAPPTVILKADTPHFTILDINEAYLEATLTEREHLVGKGFLEAFPENPDDPHTENVESLRNSLTEAAKLKRKTILPRQKYDIPIRGTGQFETRYWQATNSPVLSKDGEVDYIVHVTIDITGAYELAKQERIAFQVAEEKRIELHNLFMEAPGAICILSGPDFVFELVNPTYQSIFPGRDLLGKPVLEALPEMAANPLMDVLKNVYEKEETSHGKEVLTTLARYEGAPPEDIYWNFVYKPRYDTGGQVDGILVFAYEVTDQVNSRRMYQESEERLNLAVANANAGVFDTNLITGASIRNARHAHIFGYPDNKEDWSLQRLFNQTYPEDLEYVKNQLHKVKSLGKLDATFRIIRADGNVRWVHIVGKASYNDQGVPVRLIGTTNDITEKKELEKQKDEFVSTVSHELKTPVTSIKAYSQLLHKSLSGENNSRNRNFLDRLDNQVNRLENLIKDLLDVTRLDAGKLKLETQKVELHMLLAELISDLQLISSTHRLIITENNPACVMADANRIMQVITNLVTNAVKYSPKADRVLIALTSHETETICSVQDFGIGIDQKDRPMVFQRFHQASEHGGSGLSLGLGLYISKEIVEKAGGKIWFESQSGQGSTFYFSLPRCG